MIRNDDDAFANWRSHNHCSHAWNGPGRLYVPGVTLQNGRLELAGHSCQLRSVLSVPTKRRTQPRKKAAWYQASNYTAVVGETPR